MTDLDKLKNLLNEFGVTYEEEARENDRSDRAFSFNHEAMNKAGKTIVIKEGTERAGGYFDFYTCFEFDNDENFIEIDSWE